jgi:hypothetical protein
MNGGGANVTQTNVENMMPAACTFNALYIEVGPSPVVASTHDYTFTLVKGGSDTALTCSITDISNGSTCSDTSHTVSVAATDKVSLHVVDATSGTTPIANFMFALNCK